MNVLARPNPTGTITIDVRDPAADDTNMVAIFTPRIGELLISSYSVHELSRGNYVSVELFQETINAAGKRGKINAIVGMPGGTNLDLLRNTAGDIIAGNISKTPWAKALSKLGYETIFNGVLMESRPTRMESK